MSTYQFTEKTLAGFKYWEAWNGEINLDSPLLIIMHWLTATAKDMAFLFEDLKSPARLIFLQGLYPSEREEGGYSWFPNSQKFYTHPVSEQADVIRDEAQKIARLISAIKQEHRGRVIVTGMSQGGDLSLFLAAYHAELIDTAIPCAGRFSSEMRQVPAIQSSCKIRIQQGMDDKIVSLASAREVYQWFQAQGFDVLLDEYSDLGHDFSAEMIKRIQELIA